jgi:hypothetical protein
LQTRPGCQKLRILALAVVLDMMHWGHTAFTNRQTIPGYTAADTGSIAGTGD